MDKITPKSDVLKANLDRAAPLLKALRADGIGHMIDGTILPSIMCPMPSALSALSRGAARSRLALSTSDFGVILSMRGLRFQRLVNVVALPAGFLVVDLHVE